MVLDVAGLDPATSGLWSHSIAAGAVLALAAAVLGWRVTEDRGVAGIAGILVVLHVLTDYLTGQKPTWAHGPLIGLRLYAHPLRDFVLEATVVAVGGWLAARASEVTVRRPRVAIAAVVLLLLQAAADARLRFGERLWA